MPKRLCAAIVGAAILAGAGIARAETVPMPRPAPLKKFAAPSALGNGPASQAAPARRGAAPARLAGTGTVGQAPPRPPMAIGPAKPSTAPAPAPAPDPSPAPRNAGGRDPQQLALIGRANAYLSSIQTLVGDFVQVGPDGRRTEGQFFLQKPGRLRFEYNPPSPLELISDGESVVVRDRRLATQDLYPLSQTPLRFLLADRIDLMKDSNVIGVTADDVFVSITIEERRTLGGTHQLMLMFGAQDFQLRQWTVTDPQGYDTTVAVYNLDTAKKVDPKLFKIDYTRYMQ